MGVASAYVRISAWRKISLAGGLLSILLGLVMLLWPDKTVLVVAALVGVWLTVLGCSRIADAATGGHDKDTATGISRGFRALAGAAYLLAGVIILADLHESLRFVAVVLGAVWICAGLSEAIGGLARVGGAWVRTGAIAIGLINIVLGVLALAWPSLSLLVLVWLAALWLILLGIVQLVFAYRARQAERALRAGPG